MPDNISIVLFERSWTNYVKKRPQQVFWMFKQLEQLIKHEWTLRRHD